MSIYQNLSFKILPKNSASPTLIIVNKKTNHLYKCWGSNNTSIEAKGLDYERKVYESKINDMLKKDKDLPILRYIGSANTDMETFKKQFDIKTEDENGIFNIALMYFYKDNTIKSNWEYNDIKKYRAILKNEFTKGQQTEYYNSIRIKLIILPMVKFRSLDSILNIVSTKEMEYIIKRLVVGIYYLYWNGVIHNDLHAGNIMIEDGTNKVYIYDWDRAYVKGHDNPQLSNMKCRGLCSVSQCNIGNKDGYAIDFFKVMCYILYRRNKVGDAKTLLKNLFNIDNDIKATIVIEKLGKLPCFFNEKGCTYLQFPDNTMIYIKELFGSIQEIYKKVNTKFKFTDKKQKVNTKFKFSNGNTDKEVKKLLKMIEKGKGDEYDTFIPIEEKKFSQNGKFPEASYLDKFIEKNEINEIKI